MASNLLWRFTVNVVDPLGIWRYMLVQPLFAVFAVFVRVGGLLRRRPDEPAAGQPADDSALVRNADDRKTTSGRSNARELAYRAAFVAFGAAALLWAAVFMYLTFYYTYMPAGEHVHAVRVQYDACNRDPQPGDACEYPHAFVRLDAIGQARMRAGQTYKVFLIMDMPDSPVNHDLGIFMVCASMRDDQAVLLDHACRAAMLHYRSAFVRSLRTWLLSPLYLLQLSSERERIEIELFDAYGLDQRGPVRDVYVEVQSRQIQFYNVTLHVVAHFSGLRYAMWQWPLLSAIVGIATNLLVILMALALSWYNWGHVLRIERTVRQKLRRRAPSKDATAAALTDSSGADDEMNDTAGNRQLVVFEQTDDSDGPLPSKSGERIEKLDVGAGISGSETTLRRRQTLADSLE